MLDHVGHFVPDLDAAAALLSRLGFFATPVSHHVANGEPAGTSNRCVMLSQGYLEILAPTLDTPHAQRVRERMALYRGVHLVCYGTPDAPAEHARLAAHGFSPDPLVELRRKIESGEEVGFRVAYVPREKMPECRAQYCEHLTPEVVWKEEFLSHRNGVVGLRAAYLVADDPATVAARWAEFSGLLPFTKEHLVELRTARGSLRIGTKEQLSSFIPQVPPAPAVAAIELEFKDPTAFAARCRKEGLTTKKTRRGYSVSLPLALGGTWLF